MHQELKDREYYNGFIMNKSFRDWIKSCNYSCVYVVLQVH